MYFIKAKIYLKKLMVSHENYVNHMFVYMTHIHVCVQYTYLNMCVSYMCVYCTCVNFYHISICVYDNMIYDNHCLVYYSYVYIIHVCML